VRGAELPDDPEAGLDRDPGAARRLVADARRKRLRLLARGGADEQVAPAADDPDAFRLELRRERDGVGVPVELDAHLPVRDVVLVVLLLGRSLLGRVGALPALLVRVPAVEPRLAAQAVLGERLAELAERGLGRVPCVGVEEDRGPVARDRDPPAELLAQLVSDLPLVQRAQQRSRPAAALDGRADPPVLGHAATLLTASRAGGGIGRRARLRA